MTYSIGGLAIGWNCQSILFDGLDTNMLIKKETPAHQKAIKTFILSMPVVKSNQLKTAAGKAILSNRKITPHIKLHAALFDDRDIIKDDRLDTFFHEIAHQIAFITMCCKGHGLPWSYSMQHFGFSPDRCYDPGKFNYKGYEKRKENRAVDAIIDECMGDF